MTLINPFTGTEAKAKKPVNEDLMDKKFKENIEDLAVQIDVISGGSGVAALDTNALGEIKQGLETNDPKFFRLRYSPFSNVLNSGEKLDGDRTGFDPEGKLQSRWISIQDNDTGNNTQALANAYQGQSFRIAQGNKISFILKKGENWFGIASVKSGSSDSVTVTIDGVAIVTAGITNENGTARSNTYTTNLGNTQFQETEYFFSGSLDPNKAQRITIENTDSAAKLLDLNFIEVGFRSNDGEFILTTDEQIHINDGTAIVRGAENDFAEADLTIDAETGWGRTDAIIGDQSQVLSILKGDSPAMTQAMPNISLGWSGGFTSLRCKNTSLFPTKGFLLISQPWGQNFLASYTSKSEALINTHQFDNMLFSSTPDIDWTPLTGFGGASGGAASDFYGDLNINLWGSGGLEITNSNNKIDFKITINGAETTHAATIANGLYAANGAGNLDLASAIIDVMNTAKDLSSIGGAYFAKYSAEKQKWSLGASGNEIDAIDFDFSSGPNVANSIHTDLGFPTTDIADQLSYTATTEKQHNMAHVFQKGRFMSPDDPNIKTRDGNQVIADNVLEDIRSRLGFGNVYASVTTTNMVKIYVDPDVCGILITMVSYRLGVLITTQIDNGQFIYAAQTDRAGHISTSTRGRLQNFFVSFPRGSKTITLRTESEANFEINANTDRMAFVGATQYHSRPPLEKLTLVQSALKFFDIAPKQLFKTLYGDSGASFYSPTTNDNIDTIAFSGGFSSGAQIRMYNGNAKNTTTLNDTADITFTIVQNGGGISLMMPMNGATVRELEFYLIDGAAASEVDNLIQVNNQRWAISYEDTEGFTLLGLPAGQYTLRVKQRDSGANLTINAIGIIDGVEPEPNKNTVSDLTNNLQSITYPIHTVNFDIGQDGIDRIPSRLSRTGYKEGHSVVDYSLTLPSFNDRDQGAASFIDDISYFGSNAEDAGINSFFRSFLFCKSFTHYDHAFTNRSTSVQPNIDDRTSLNIYSQRVQTKAGSAPSSTRGSAFPLFSKNFFLLASGNMSNSTTFLLNDTRGLRIGAKIILKNDNGPTTEIRTIATITADTNFTITEAVATFGDYTTGNNASVSFIGFHTLKINNDAALTIILSSISFEPLDIIESKFSKRLLAKNKTETVSVLFTNVANNDSLFYPVHSDGIMGNFRTSSIDIIATSAASTYNIQENLKQISVGSGTIDVKIVSTREVPND